MYFLRRLSLATVRKSFSPLARLFVLASLMLLQSSCDRGHKFWTNWYTPGDTVDNVGYHPEQPIDFPHDKHVARGVPCQYCHSSARRSQTAGIPPLNTCMGCHQYVRTEADPIKFITAKWKAGEAVEWVKVHDLPDFVRFSHRPHVQKGLACAECHGEVEKMTTVAQAKSLQMGWCVECHMANKAPIKCVTCHY